ncbi:MAG TPA: hypothetical protein VFH92_09500, partial [Phenylobacterium sp.]|nr:hypothetical protein [Phenylobacterium sp.]
MDNPDLRLRIIREADEMLARLASGLALAGDSALQAEVRLAAGVSPGRPLWVRLPASEAWLGLIPGQATRVERQPPPRAAAFQLDAKPGSDGLADKLMGAAFGSAFHEEAHKVLTPIFDPARVVSRRQMAALLRWAPVLEHAAYRMVAVSTQHIDNLRKTLEAPLARGGGALDRRQLEYWGHLHTMSHLTLVAATPGATPWLVDMARAFTWVTWTPTFTLLRERTLWLAAAAARSAAAFGADVADLYLAKLRTATHPLVAFDALFGLLAIGLGDARSASEIEVMIARERRPPEPGAPHPAQLGRMVDTALAVLRDPHGAARWARLSDVWTRPRGAP